MRSDGHEGLSIEIKTPGKGVTARHLQYRHVIAIPPVWAAFLYRNRSNRDLCVLCVGMEDPKRRRSQVLRTRMPRFFVAFLLSVISLSLFVLKAPTASAATSCVNIAVIHRSTHLVFLWRVIPRSTSVETIDGKRVIRIVPRHRVHVWRHVVRIVHGKREIQNVPVKVRRVFSIVEHKTVCTTIPPPTATLSINTSSLPSTGGSVVLSFSSTNATTCSLSSTPVLWSGANPATVNCNGTYDASVASDTSQQQWAITFSATNSAGESVTSTQTLTEVAPPPPPPPPPPTATLSINTSSLPSTGGSVVLSFSSTNATTCSLSSTPVLWSGANPLAVNCNGTYDASVASDTSQQQWAITFSATNSAGQSATSTQTLTQVAPSSAPATTTLTQSQNWSGYVVPSSSSLVTQTSGEFTVPTLDCAATPNADVGIWVGTGGTGNAALLQTGVASSCVNGAQQDYGWWEEVPSNPNNAVNFTGFTVSPGDVIEASVFQMNTGAWETSVDDLTTGLTGIMRTGDGWGVSTGGSTGSFTPQGSTVGLSYSGAYTGEWIVEDPESNGSLATFADYGTVSFTNLTTSISSWSLTPGEGYEIVQANTVISTPSSPSNGAFSVTYTG